jgi:hypothetical protein
MHPHPPIEIGISKTNDYNKQLLLSNLDLKSKRAKRLLKVLSLIILALFFTTLFTPFLTTGNPVNSDLINQSLQTQKPAELSQTRSRAVFSVNYLATFEENGTIETNNFYFGNKMVIKCNISHDEGAPEIQGTRVTIINKNDGSILLPYTDMHLIDELIGTDWKWYTFTYHFSMPFPRETYEVVVKSMSYSPVFQEIKKSVEINIINQFPRINGDISPIYKTEKSPPWNINLSGMKADLEDSGTNLTWSIQNVSKSLLWVKIHGDILKFEIIRYAYGSNQLKLVLTDSDNDFISIKFWVHITPVNDPPEITPPIPDQFRLEDSQPWSINLTNYGRDIEDGATGLYLNWSVFDFNTSLLDIEIHSNFTSQLLIINPVENAYGTNLIRLTAQDSDGEEVSQTFWIRLSSVNDAPQWEKMPNLYLTNQNNKEILKISDFIKDIDTPLEKLEYSISKSSPDKMDIIIGSKGELNIIISDPNFIGPGQIEIMASDGVNEVVTNINLTIHLAKFKVKLLTPENSSIITSQTPTLAWELIKPGGMGEVKFDFYLDSDRKKVSEWSEKIFNRALDIETTTLTSRSELDDGKWYYWTVRPKYVDHNNNIYWGDTEGGVREFKVDINYHNLQPLTMLLVPKPQEVINNATVNLTWHGFDPDMDTPITYELYLSTSKSAVIDHNNEFKIDLPDPESNYYVVTNLHDDEIYYWTVIPTTNNQHGECVTIFSNFAVDLTNTKPKTVLLLPNDGNSVPIPPILYWDFEDPDPYEFLYFDIYLNKDKELVLGFHPQARIATVQDLTHYYLPIKYEPGKYYWTVISNDKIGPGTCECGVWEFTIDPKTTNHPPLTHLIVPQDQTIRNENTVKLTWNSTDPESDKIIYHLYLSSDYESVSGLDDDVKIIATAETSMTLTDLEDGEVYYWTVIPDDGKASGLCLDEIWSFQYNSEEIGESEKESQEDQMFQWILIIIVVILIFVLISITGWYLKKHSRETELTRYLAGKPDEEITNGVKTGLLSTSTLRALHSDYIETHGREHGHEHEQEHEVKDGDRYKIGHTRKGDTRDKGEELASFRGKKKISSLSKSRKALSPGSKSSPYFNGEYGHSIEKSPYVKAGLKAEQVKRAIPYAKGSDKENHILTKKDIKLATPLQKEIMKQKAIKASSMPITRQCPECGSFKVKTYKDDSNKCLSCKHRF